MPIKDPVKRAEYAVKYREARREEAKERSRKWREQFPDRLKESQRSCYLKHREQRLEAARRYREENAEKLALWKEQNRDLLRERDRLSYQKHILERRAADKKYRTLYPEKQQARAWFRYLVRTGQVLEQPCVVCGTMEFLEGHHEDYTKPLDVVWLCRKHHRERHRKQVEASSSAPN